MDIRLNTVDKTVILTAGESVNVKELFNILHDVDKDNVDKWSITVKPNTCICTCNCTCKKPVTSPYTPFNPYDILTYRTFPTTNLTNENINCQGGCALNQSSNSTNP